MATVYILHSESIDKYYIGSCLNLETRLEQHKNKVFISSFTKRADDWQLFFMITDLSYRGARKIEIHIKSMKSRKYIENLKKYEDISLKLRHKFS